MRLSEVELLTADYSNSDVSELVAVIQSTRFGTPSAVLRYGKVPPSDLEAWLRKSCSGNLKHEFQLGRISSIQTSDEVLPSVPLAEHLIVRDLDIRHLEPEDKLPPGRIVAHAEYRFLPSYGTLAPSEVNSPDSLNSCPAGFRQDLQVHINSSVETTLFKLFGELPCFELHNISTLTPSHIRKGIATRLTNWVFSYADQLALPVMLSASPLGLAVYQKCGFVEYRQYDVVIDLEKWGGHGVHALVNMVRWPTNMERLPDAWKQWRNTHTAPLEAKEQQ